MYAPREPSPPAPLPQAGEGGRPCRLEEPCKVRRAHQNRFAIAGTQGLGGPATPYVGFMRSPDESREAAVEHSPDFIRATG
jgi:hypothetical protein